MCKSVMYPIKMMPCYKEMPWGGNALNMLYGKKSNLTHTGESWEAACHRNGSSIAQNGEYAGKTLGELAIELGKTFLGERVKTFSEFPVLFKLIDARERLSLQVHPDDALAAADNDNGKTEMWIVLSATEGAGLYLGFKKEISREEYRSRIADNSLEEVLCFVPATAGDTFFLPAGMVHAIGDGLVIAEIQQNSDATYRVYDWGRLGLDGKLRPLHIEKAIAASNLSMRGDKSIQVSTDKMGVRRSYLPGCEHFAAQGVVCTRTAEENTKEESFQIVFCFDGAGYICANGSAERFEKGDTFVIPAALGMYEIKGSVSYYRFWIPSFIADYYTPLKSEGYDDAVINALFNK